MFVIKCRTKLLNNNKFQDKYLKNENEENVRRRAFSKYNKQLLTFSQQLWLLCHSSQKTIKGEKKSKWLTKHIAEDS